MRLVLLAILAAAAAAAQSPADSAASSSSSSADSNFGLGGIHRGPNYQPLTPKERWQLWWNNSFASPGAYIRSVGPAISDHASGIPENFPHGAAGFGARVGSRFGRFSVAGGIQSAMGQALGHDPRYIASNRPGAWPRFRQAFLYNFLTYDRNGKPVLDVSTLTGQFASEAMFAHWSGQRWDVKGYQGLIQQVAFGWTVNLVREYWPEIKNTLKFKKRKANSVPQTTGSNTPADKQP